MNVKIMELKHTILDKNAEISRLKGELEEANSWSLKAVEQFNRAEDLERQIAEAMASVQFYKEAQAYAENQYLLAIQETNLLRGNIKEANSQIETLTDCLNGSRGDNSYTGNVLIRNAIAAMKYKEPPNVSAG